jgi:hypothetical protein
MSTLRRVLKVRSTEHVVTGSVIAVIEASFMEGRESSERSPMLISACMGEDFVTVLFFQSYCQGF